MTRSTVALALLGVASFASPAGGQPVRPPTQPPAAEVAAPDPHARDRERMVREQIAARGVSDPAVLRAMREVPRHRFVPPDQRAMAHRDGPLPIGRGQTISQPYIVAWMTELAGARPGLKALDVGTGSGYQAAVLAQIVDHVYGIERLCDLADGARDRLTELGARNITLRCGDGFQGWPEHAPFDLIIVAAAPEEIPPALIEQLAPGGRLVIPVGPQRRGQELRVVSKSRSGEVTERVVGGVRFVPLVPGSQGDGSSPERAAPVAPRTPKSEETP